MQAMEEIVTDDDLQFMESVAAKFEEELRRFSEDTDGESDLAIMLRGHLYIENQLENLLSQALVHPEMILDKRMRFVDKTRLAVAMGLISKKEMYAILRLNELRGAFAQNPAYQISAKDTTKVIGSFSKRQKQSYQKYKEKLDEKFASNENLKLSIFTVWVTLFEDSLIPADLKERLQRHSKWIKDQKKKHKSVQVDDVV